MKKNLTVEMTNVTPELAANLLKFNKRNRAFNEKNTTFLSNQIKKGTFLENGESIVFDEHGELKDGQHRLKAISINKESFLIPIVRGVQEGVMATYDTGKMRSASDVLKLNGYKNCNNLAALIKSIDKYCKRKSKSSGGGGGSRKSSALSNQEVLDYAKDNYDWLNTMTLETIKITNKMNNRILAPSSVSLILYLIGGENPSRLVIEFVNHLMGNLKSESSAPLYVFNKLYNSKINKEPLNFYWVLGMSLKAWNYYSEGNPAIRFIKFDVSSDLPAANK